MSSHYEIALTAISNKVCPLPNVPADILEQAFVVAARNFSCCDPPKFKGRGIVICGGGTYFPSAWVTINAIRFHGCTLPIELWYIGDELNRFQMSIVNKLGVTCIDATNFDCRKLNGFTLKPLAILHSSFEQVLLLDADNSPVKDPEYLFDSLQFKTYGAYFFRDKNHTTDDVNFYRLNGFSKDKCKIFEIDYKDEPSSETGQILIDKSKCWKEINLTLWWNEFNDFTYKYTWFDKDTFVLAWRTTKKDYFLTSKHPITGYGLQQYDANGDLIFLHRCGDKWNLYSNLWLNRPQEELLHGFILELKEKMLFL